MRLPHPSIAKTKKLNMSKFNSHCRAIYLTVKLQCGICWKVILYESLIVGINIKLENVEDSMALIQIKDKAQITIPSKIRKELGINKGDYLEATIEADRIVLIPKIVIDKDSVALSEQGEKYLKEALLDIKENKFKIHDKVEELIDDLKK